MGIRVTQATWGAQRAAAKAKAREALAEDAVETAPSDLADTTGEPQSTAGENPYTEWSDEELLEEFTERELELEEDSEGTREELIEALEADDSDQSEEE